MIYRMLHLEFCWANETEIWNSIGPLSELVLSGTPVSKEDDFLLFKQLPHQGNGTFEVYHSWMWVPILQEDGSVGGLWNATIDTTNKVLAERRLATVREMGERTCELSFSCLGFVLHSSMFRPWNNLLLKRPAIARTMQEFDSAVIDIMSSNARDVPFASLYHVEVKSKTADKAGVKGNSTSAPAPGSIAANQALSSVKCQLTLAGSVGVPDNHPNTPSTCSVTLNMRQRESRAGIHNLTGSPTLSVISTLSGGAKRTSTPSQTHTSDGEDGGGLKLNLDAWPFREALQTRRIVLVDDCSSLIEGYPVRVWDELPNAAVVVPISNESDEGVPSSVIVIGLSIRRPFDDDYESFLVSDCPLPISRSSSVCTVGSETGSRLIFSACAASSVGFRSRGGEVVRSGTTTD